MENGARLKIIRGLVGDVTEEELRYVDSFVSARIGLFMPVGGACYYALKPLHAHPSYSFILSFDGKTSVRIDRRVIRKSGGILAISPGIAHHELPSESSPRYIAVFIERRFFEKELSCYTSDKGLCLRGDFFSLPSDLQGLLKRFMAEERSAVSGSESVLEALGVEICHTIIRAALGVNPPKEQGWERVEVNRAIEYMLENLQEKITVRDLSNSACISPSHFSRVFKKETGYTPMEYLGRMRLERVKKLILAGDKSMTEIAFECGFKSPAYLSARFRKACGVAPKEYLFNLKKGAPSKKDKRIAKDPPLED